LKTDTTNNLKQFKTNNEGVRFPLTNPNTMKVKEVKLIDTVDDGFNYFNYRLEELKTDDKYYINSFMDYIQCLEIKINKLSKKLKTK